MNRVLIFLPIVVLLLLVPNTLVSAQSPETDITREGTVSASTVYPGYQVAWSIDGDRTTSWFSTGPEKPAKPGDPPPPTKFQWTHSRDDLITTIYIHGNNDTTFPTGYGFRTFVIQVLDARGAVVFQTTTSLAGSPEQDITVHPNVVGRTVLLLLSGHEAPDCGGFSEIQVKADRTPPTAARPAPASTLPPVAAGTVIASDDLNRADADRCQLGPLDNALGGTRTLYFLPIFPTNNDATKPIGANLVSGALQNNGLDFGGIQFALSPPCQSPIGTIRGANIGQDLNIRVDLLVPTNSGGLITQAGPYVRSRAAAYGDGIIGGTSAGYWVRLESTGEVTVRRLNPNAVIAFSGKPASFNPSVMHRVEIAAGGNQLQVSLDGNLQTFNQDNQLVTTVATPATGGSNDGTAGIAFGAEPNRGQIGGQKADNLLVTAYHPLTGLPVQNNFAGPTATPAPTNTSLATATPTTNAGASGTPTLIPSSALAGDCDGDGKVTEADALCALEMSTGSRPATSNMDVDGDGAVTSRDAVVILQRAVGR